MIESQVGLKSITALPIGGVNEVDVPTEDVLDFTAYMAQKWQPSRFIKMENWRFCQEGNRLQKRGGTSLVADIYNGATPSPIYGFQTYHNASNVFCMIAVSGAAIWRKIGTGAWTSIYTWGTAITHPVKIYEVHSRIYILTEVANVMLLKDGTLVQVGITAPATIPTIAASYESTLLNEPFTSIAAWTDDDAGSGASALDTSLAAPHASCLKLLNTGSSSDLAKRHLTTGIVDIGDIYNIEFDLYIDAIGTFQDSNHLLISVYNGRNLFQLRITKNDYYVFSGASWVGAGADVETGKWIKHKIYVNTAEPGQEYCEIYKEDYSLGEYNCVQSITTTPGRVEIGLYGATVATQAHIDNFIIANPKGGNLLGLIRYAVAYRRSGNYGEVSNPIKCLIGTVTYKGGANPTPAPLTISGTYTGEKTRNIRVQVDGTGTPDTFKWSEDGGTTWNSTVVSMAAKNLIIWGLELNWTATTGHTAGGTPDYWDFTCYAMAVVALHQKVTLSSLPVSSDAQVDQKDIYRTQPGGALFYLAGTIANAQTTFVDNSGDESLGLDMKEDRDIMPVGKFSAWWDDRFWVCDTAENIIYYSDISFPEAFKKTGTDARYISVKMGETDDTLNGIIPFRGELYPFKKKSIFVLRKKAGGVYGRYQVCRDFGAIAGYAINETFGLLTFLSFRGWEIFNGEEGLSDLFGLPIDRTMKTVNITDPDKIVACTNTMFNEIWLSTPSLDGGGAAITHVCNYKRGKCFYHFRFAATPSCLVQARDANGKLQQYMGTTSGKVLLCEDGYLDESTVITASARTVWLKVSNATQWRLIETEFEAPVNMNLTVKLYGDFQYVALRTAVLAGATPTSTDLELRRAIRTKSEAAVRAQHLSLEFLNAENLGGQMKINDLTLHYVPLFRKERQAGN